MLTQPGTLTVGVKLVAVVMYIHLYLTEQIGWSSIGTTYKIPCALVLGLMSTQYNYGKLLSIYVVNHKPLFHVQMLETVEFCTNFHCYYCRVAFTRGLSGCKRLSFISSFTYTHLLWYVI